MFYIIGCVVYINFYRPLSYPFRSLGSDHSPKNIHPATLEYKMSAVLIKPILQVWLVRPQLGLFGMMIGDFYLRQFHSNCKSSTCNTHPDTIFQLAASPLKAFTGTLCDGGRINLTTPIFLYLGFIF